MRKQVIGTSPDRLDTGQPGSAVLLINQDLTATITVGFSPLRPGDSTGIDIPPLGSLARDTSRILWAVSDAPGTIMQIAEGGSSWSPSPAQIATQIALQGINVNITGINVITPSGDITGATDTAKINGQLASAGIGQVNLQPGGIYYINAPILIKSFTGLNGGNMRQMAIPTGNYGIGGLAFGGAIIKPVAGFAGSAAILMASPGAVQSGNVDIRCLSIDGSSLPAGTVHGIEANGAWGGASITDVLVWKVTGNGLYAHNDGTSQPDFWHVSDNKFSACGGNGVEIAGLADSWFTDCEATGNTGDDWKITNGNNSRFTNCKGEFAGGASHGFNIIGASGFTGVVTFINCGGGNNGGQLFNVSGTGTGTFRFINPFSYQGLPVPCNVTGTNLTPGLPFWFSLGTLFAYTVTKGRYRIKLDDELELDVQVTPNGANAAVTTFSNALPNAYQPATVRRFTMETGRAVTNGDPWPTLIVNANGNVDVSTQLAILSTLEYNGSVPLD